MRKSILWGLLEFWTGPVLACLFLFLFKWFGFNRILLISAIFSLFLFIFLTRLFRVFKSYWLYKEGSDYAYDLMKEDDIEEAKYVFGIKNNFDEKLGDLLKKSKEDLTLEYLKSIGYIESTGTISNEIKTDAIKTIIDYKESKLQNYFTSFIVRLSRTMVAVVFIQILLVTALTLYISPSNGSLILRDDIKPILLISIGALLLIMLCYAIDMWTRGIILNKRYIKKYK